MKKAIIMAATIGLLATPAFGQAVKVKKAWDSVNNEYTASAKYIKEKCGADVKVEADTASFGKDLEQINVASWCKGSASSLAELCTDEDYKAAILKEVKKIRCKYDKGIKKDSAAGYGNKFEIKGGTFTHALNKDTANVDSESRKWLQDNLGAD